MSSTPTVTVMAKLYWIDDGTAKMTPPMGVSTLASGILVGLAACASQTQQCTYGVRGGPCANLPPTATVTAKL